jgi:hypothetical protein
MWEGRTRKGTHSCDRRGTRRRRVSEESILTDGCNPQAPSENRLFT